MTRFIVALFFASFCLGNSAWAKEAREGCVQVKPGDTLWGISRSLKTTVSDLAAKNSIRNPSRIHPGQKICRDEEGENPSKESDVPQKQPEKPKILKTTQTDVASVEGYTPYVEVGRNPLVPKEKRDPQKVSPVEKDAIIHVGGSILDAQEIEQMVLEGKCENISIPKGQRIVAMSEAGKHGVKITYNRVTAWSGTRRGIKCTTSSGFVAWRSDDCFNWMRPFVEPKETPEAVALTAVTPEPEPKPEESEGCGWDDYDLFLSRGGTHGNGSSTTYNYADGFVCLYKTRVDNGTVKAGAEGLASNWQGSADDGFGYRGKKYGVGPAGKYFSDDGWDARLGLLFGGVANDGHSADGNYQQERNFRFFGPTAGINLYQREMAGEKWFPKTQLWFSAFKLHGASLSQSWQGMSIQDTSNLKSSWLISAGVREFIYQGPIKPWVSASLDEEIPMTRNLTLILGVTDEKEILWAGVGGTRDLKHGGWARSWMVALDAGNANREIRSDARHDNWVATETSYYDEETGAFTTKKQEEGDDAIPSPSSPSVARFDIASGQFVKSSSIPAVSKPAVAMTGRAREDRQVNRLVTARSVGGGAVRAVEPYEYPVVSVSPSQSSDPWKDSWAQK